MFEGDLVDDSESEPGATGRLPARRGETVERLEYGFHLLGRNPGAAVGNFDGDLLFSAMQVDVNGFAVAVLHGVLQQVGHYPFQCNRVREVHAGWVVPVQPQVGAFELQVGSQ